MLPTSWINRINRIPPRKFVAGLAAIFGVFALLVLGVVVLFDRISHSRSGSEISTSPKSESELSSFSSKKRANAAAYEAYMKGYNDPEMADIAGQLSDRFAEEDLKVVALMVIGAKDRREGKDPRYDLLD